MRIKAFFNFLLVVMMLITSFAVSQPVAAATEDIQIQKVPVRLDAPHVDGEIVVQMAGIRGATLAAVTASAFSLAAENQAELTRLTQTGTLVMRVNEGNLSSTLNRLNSDPGILYAEPNYLFALPQGEAASDEYRLNSEYVIRKVEPSAETDYKSLLLEPISALQEMKRTVGATVQGTYPNDPYAFTNGGYSTLGADIVWSNTTPSATVCVVDTGVQNTHKDLYPRIINGYDFVNGDAVPDDQNGHGTHVAGIISALRDNKIGIAGVSSGSVVAVKAMDAQGYGTNFDIAVAVEYCANRSDTRVINLSVASTVEANRLKTAIKYAIDTKNRLVVASAGNYATDTKYYPAGWADTADFSAKGALVAVAASGQDDGLDIDYYCPWASTNYGSWISVVAPGNSIYSTTPWDVPFYNNYEDGWRTRFDSVSGTSQAAAFVSAAAARYWGYKPTSTNAQVVTALTSKGTVMDTDGCWAGVVDPGTVQVNVAKLMDRGGLKVGVFDASTGTPLWGATLAAYQGSARVGLGVLQPLTYTIPGETDLTQFYMTSNLTTDIINLPTIGLGYSVRVNKVNYTIGDQPAFQHEQSVTLVPGEFKSIGSGSVPLRSANFSVVMGWAEQQPWGDKDKNPLTPIELLALPQGSHGNMDLDLELFLPDGNTTLVQPARFVVGDTALTGLYTGDPADLNPLNDSYGMMTDFPYARLIREGGTIDDTAIEMISIRNRYISYSGVAANAGLPYYPNGATVSGLVDTTGYFGFVTDYGQTIDHDADGCGDNYGTNALTGYDPNYVAANDPDCNAVGATLGVPLLGTYLTPYVYVWKDGYVRAFVNGSNATTQYWPIGSACSGKHWWKALQISNGTNTAVVPQTVLATVKYDVYSPSTPGVCDNESSPNFLPYTTP